MEHPLWPADLAWIMRTCARQASATSVRRRAENVPMEGRINELVTAEWKIHRRLHHQD
jgi:hypothetical protein